MSLEDSKRRIHEIACLEDGWDSFGAAKIAYPARMAALTIIEKFDHSTPVNIYPVADGGVQIEFDLIGDDKNIEVYIDIDPTGLFSIDAL